MPVRRAISFVPSSVSASASASSTLNARWTAPTSLNAGWPVRGIDRVSDGGLYSHRWLYTQPSLVASSETALPSGHGQASALRERLEPAGKHGRREREDDPAGRDDADPAVALPGETGDEAADRACEVVQAEIER